MFVGAFEVFSVTHQCCDRHQGPLAIMFREDSQIDFAEKNTPPLPVRPILYIDNQFKMC